MINDLAARAKATQPEDELPERRRTVLVWLIFAYACYVLLSSIIFAGMALLGVQLNAAPRLAPIYYVISLGGVACYFAGCLALFNLRAKAVAFLSVGLAINVALGIYSLLVMRLEDYPPPPGPLDPATWQQYIRAIAIGSMVIGLAIYGAILAYAVRLRRRGILLPLARAAGPRDKLTGRAS
jgi:hypothetical protein